MRLRGKTAIVTGTSKGIGAAIAERFALEGASVFGIDRIPATGNQGASGIASPGAEIAFHEADVSRESAVRGAVDACLARFGTVDVLVNNAAVQYEVPLHETTYEQWRTMIDINLGGYFLTCKHAIPIMQRARGGVIINISSVLGLVADPKLAVYCSTKGGILAMTRAIAIAYGHDGIRANCICPGDVDTPLNQAYFDSFSDPAAARAGIENEYPLGRIATPDEIARVAVFLASEDASFINGTHVVVDGGVLAKIY